MVLTKEQLDEITEFILKYGIDGKRLVDTLTHSSSIFKLIYDMNLPKFTGYRVIREDVKQSYLEQLNNV